MPKRFAAAAPGSAWPKISSKPIRAPGTRPHSHTGRRPDRQRAIVGPDILVEPRPLKGTVKISPMAAACIAVLTCSRPTAPCRCEPVTVKGAASKSKTRSKGIRPYGFQSTVNTLKSYRAEALQ
jgi:hypothetical protein